MPSLFEEPPVDLASIMNEQNKDKGKKQSVRTVTIKNNPVSKNELDKTN